MRYWSFFKAFNFKNSFSPGAFLNSISISFLVSLRSPKNNPECETKWLIILRENRGEWNQCLWVFWYQPVLLFARLIYDLVSYHTDVISRFFRVQGTSCVSVRPHSKHPHSRPSTAEFIFPFLESPSLKSKREQDLISYKGGILRRWN